MSEETFTPVSHLDNENSGSTSIDSEQGQVYNDYRDDPGYVYNRYEENKENIVEIASPDPSPVNSPEVEAEPSYNPEPEFSFPRPQSESEQSDSNSRPAPSPPCSPENSRPHSLTPIRSPDPSPHSPPQFTPRSPDPSPPCSPNQSPSYSPDPSPDQNLDPSGIHSPDPSPVNSTGASPVRSPENLLDFEDEAYSSVDKKTKEIESSQVDTCKNDESSTSEKKSKNKEEEPKDDGECSDGGDEDLEEGELNDDTGREDSTNSKSNSASKQTCRFYSRGQCFFGQNCRFAHVNSASGNYYSMFAPTTPVIRVPYPDYFDPSHAMLGHRSGTQPLRSTGSDFLPPPPVSPSMPAEESAWERGLQTAKELVRKANKRKIEDADFSEKSLNLSLNVNEKNVPEYLDNDVSYKKKKRDMQYSRYDDPHDVFDDYEARSHYRQGFDNFDARYHREQHRGRERMEREPRDKLHPKSPHNKDKFREDRMFDGPSRSRDFSRDANDYFDPWRRSKSPKGASRRSRSRSGSYSSVSSYSWSDRSLSSYSYSRSSRSSTRSPRSQQKRKPSPPITNPPFMPAKPGPVQTNTFTTIKKKPVEARGGINTSRSRTPSISRSRSRSFSRSLSMSSVSSASSRDSLSSGSPSRHQNSTSKFGKQEKPSVLIGKSANPTNVPGPVPAAIPLPSSYLNNSPKNKIDNYKPAINVYERDPLEENFLAENTESLPFPSLQHLLPPLDKPKVVPHKQQIKLTLLNKNKMTSFPKVDLDDNKRPFDDSSKSSGSYIGVKSPESPPRPMAAPRPPPVLVPKKSASSRRDELLKQLKAVEDAIARKRAKFG